MSGYITQQNVNQYELLTPLLESAYWEMQELSKKKQESPLNSYKVKALNRILVPLKELLINEDVYSFLDILETDDLPTNSDVVLILSQYKKAMDMYYKRYYVIDKDTRSYKWSLEPLLKTTSTKRQKQ